MTSKYKYKRMMIKIRRRKEGLVLAGMTLGVFALFQNCGAPQSTSEDFMLGSQSSSGTGVTGSANLMASPQFHSFE